MKHLAIGLLKNACLQPEVIWKETHVKVLLESIKMLIFYGIYWALAPVGTSRSLFLPGSVVFREGPWTSGSSLTVMKRTVAGHWQVYAMLLKKA